MHKYTSVHVFSSRGPSLKGVESVYITTSMDPDCSLQDVVRCHLCETSDPPFHCVSCDKQLLQKIFRN